MRLKLTLPLFVIVLAIIGGCTKNTVHERYTIYRPIYMDGTDAINSIKSTGATSIGNPSKIYLRGNYVFVSEALKGVHVIDISNVAAPKNVAFINMPGNNDIAIKDNILLADCGRALVSVDITHPETPAVVKTVKDILPQPWYNGLAYDSTKVIIGWTQKDTAFTMTDEELARFKNTTGRGWLINFSATSTDAGSSKSEGGNGTGGSLSRFGVINDYLYAIGSVTVTTVNVQDPATPVKVLSQYAGNDMETIFPFNDSKFLVGTQLGMMAFDISNPQKPVSIGFYSHFRGCDPVIADNKYAYITIKSGTTCGSTLNQLEIADISNFQRIQPIKTYQLSHPSGLSKDGNTLFICDDADGLKVFDAADVNNLVRIAQLKTFTPKDVIVANGKGLVIAKEGFYIFDYSDLNNIHVTGKVQ